MAARPLDDNVREADVYLKSDNRIIQRAGSPLSFNTSGYRKVTDIVSSRLYTGKGRPQDKTESRASPDVSYVELQKVSGILTLYLTFRLDYPLSSGNKTSVYIPGFDTLGLDISNGKTRETLSPEMALLNSDKAFSTWNEDRCRRGWPP
ncbi:hypothetical protein ElyMa_003480500 [Elysia marginata]|uniref:Uncharacterized protein n=1 Tax=Elysia marginata TaxID=1093978 RepID=A0AAV4ED04_9GAST|nr:hypothetical protein ElyMa_003480500 [Elysia marginata]